MHWSKTHLCNGSTWILHTLTYHKWHSGSLWQGLSSGIQQGTPISSTYKSGKCLLEAVKACQYMRNSNSSYSNIMPGFHQRSWFIYTAMTQTSNEMIISLSWGMRNCGWSFMQLLIKSLKNSIIASWTHEHSALIGLCNLRYPSQDRPPQRFSLSQYKSKNRW